MADRLADQKSAAIRIFSNCSNAEELVVQFRPLYRMGVLFVPALNPPLLAEQFSVTLELKSQILLRATGVQVEPFAQGLATGGYQGIAILFSDVSPSGKLLLEKLANTKDGTIPFAVPSGATDDGRIYCTVTDVTPEPIARDGDEITNVEPPRKRAADTMEPTFVRKEGQQRSSDPAGQFPDEITAAEITQQKGFHGDEAALVGANAQGPEGSAVLALGDLLGATDKAQPKRRFLEAATALAPAPVQHSPQALAPAVASAPPPAEPFGYAATPVPSQGRMATPLPPQGSMALGLAVTAQAGSLGAVAGRPTSTTDMVDSTASSSALGIAIAAVVAAGLGLGTGYLLWGASAAPEVEAESLATLAMDGAAVEATVVADAGSPTAALLSDARSRTPKSVDASVEATAARINVGNESCTASITSIPDGAEIFSKGKLLGKSPYKGPIICDPVSLQFKLAGYSARTVKFNAREEQELSAKLAKLAKKKQLNYRIRVSSIPKTSLVKLNGKRAGWTPLVLQLPAEEESVLTFVKRGFNTVEKKVTPKRNGKVKARLRRGKNRRR